MHSTLRLLISVLLALWASAALAQDTAIAFQGLKASSGKPVEITSDRLEIRQDSQMTVFKGNVLVIQGDLRLKADQVEVNYGKESRAEIEQLVATGNVLLASPTEAAESQTAIYSLSSKELEMKGDVLLTMGSSILSGQVLFINLDTGTGRMEGKVRSVISTGASGQ